jgi:hypothetical protein
MKRVLAWVVLIGAIACSEETPPSTLAAAARPERDRPTEVEMVAAMEAHYGVAILAHDALVQGELETFRSKLAVVSGQALPPGSPDAWLPLQERLREAARRAAQARDLDAAANGIAGVVLACGTCHSALATGPVYPAPAPADGESALQNAMLDHQWATERLWEGVTGPWDNAWERGADALATLELFGAGNATLKYSGELRRREQELRKLGEQARATTDLDERAALYGHLIATCGKCHQLIGETVSEGY